MSDCTDTLTKKSSRSRLLKKSSYAHGYNGKTKYMFFFGHNGIEFVIHFVFDWICDTLNTCFFFSFAFDWIYDTLFVFKSSFESFLAIFPFHLILNF